ncbi:hypothetical protein DPMN_154633 [Dreissena polymorpha]|uniref:C-type lectin domain-containing protein n=2 Tax=Dreissena polymorpha TaxID=45954 RepID=A0A9D4J9A2_DREPO|nr:hypothetical protein DPMN_154633 [Dreissena polymorpha]
MASAVQADFSCICNYNVESTVYASTAKNSAIGYMYEFDCKAEGPPSNDPDWVTIQYEKQYGYMAKGQGIETQVCPGAPPETDKVTTTTATTTPTSTTTTTLTTSAAAPTTTITTVPSTTTITYPNPTTTTPVPTTSTTTTSTSTTPTTLPTSYETTTPISTTTTTQPTQIQYGCPKRYFQHAQLHQGTLFTVDSTCYEIVPTPATWKDAEAHCVARGGHLAHIPDQRHQDAIYQVTIQHLGHDVWIGLNDINQERHYEWSSGATMSTVLATTTPMPQLSNTDGDIHMCPGPVKQESRRNNYPLAQYGDSCYELQTHSAIWTHSELLCKQQGGHLVAITSETEQAFVGAFMTRHNPVHAVWLGLHDRKVEGQFEWTSGESVSYTNWVPNHTSNFVSHNTEDCIALIPYNSSKWDDLPCGQQGLLFGDVGEKHYTFCEYKVLSSHGSSVLVG